MVEESTLEETTQPEQIALSIFPDLTPKNKYLSYRASGFKVNEACDMANITLRTVQRWRIEDESFKNMELNIRETGKELAREYVNLEFLRNYRMILEKDFRIIRKSLQTPEAITDKEQAYLLKARAHYTPQQLQIIEQVLGAPNQPGNLFDFTKFILRASVVSPDGAQRQIQLAGVKE